MQIALAQLNFLVGDVQGNLEKIIQAAEQARDELAAQLVVFPELSLTGYPPEDLLWRPGLQKKIKQAIEHIQHNINGIGLVVGYPRSQGSGLYNSASLIYDGNILATYDKACLPNYSVFDEKRYFNPGLAACVVNFKGVNIGITICEDVWVGDPIEHAVAQKADIIVNLNASPFHMDKYQVRERIVADQAKMHRIAIVYVNLIGGQDELVFDGASFVVDAQGEIIKRVVSYREAIDVVEYCEKTKIVRDSLPATIATAYPAMLDAIYQALVLGVRDYVRKNNFAGVVLGLSGGIDSALTLVIAVDALGADNVEAVLLPSRYTSDMSNDDANALAINLDVTHKTYSIEPVFESFLSILAPEFAGYEPDVTEENLQARCRGMILMAISNKKKKLVLTTGNKSELAVGYSTLYGDMAGGLDVLKDVPKTLVFALANAKNRDKQVIPQRIIDRPPSAELRDDQKDEDSLPPYPQLDAVLEMYVEQDQSIESIIEAGYDSEMVRRIAWLVDLNEYKRRQAPPGVRITSRAFGKDRRYPITSGYREWS